MQNHLHALTRCKVQAASNGICCNKSAPCCYNTRWIAGVKASWRLTYSRKIVSEYMMLGHNHALTMQPQPERRTLTEMRHDPLRVSTYQHVNSLYACLRGVLAAHIMADGAEEMLKLWRRYNCAAMKNDT